MANAELIIRTLEERDLAATDRIMRLAFGTFIGLPDPLTFMGDAEYVRARWLADPTAVFGAELDGEIVASNFATHWGSVGFFGPLTVRPDLWDRGIAKRLMQPVMECFARWKVTHAGLYTFAQSTKHVRLYHRFGFRPRFLTAIMSKDVAPVENAPSWSRLTAMPRAEQETAIAACRDVTHAIYEGLDVAREIRAILDQKLGEVVLLSDSSQLSAFAVCHMGAGTEAGSGQCYIKFAAVRPSSHAEQNFNELLTACEDLASREGASRMTAGVNTSRYEAYAQMITRGFITDIQGVTMHNPNEGAYHGPGVYVIDDWR